MTGAEYRVESNQPIFSRLLPASGQRQMVLHDRALAVALAAKSVSSAQEIRVVHIPTGEVVFSKPTGPAPLAADDC